ncbi:hypothetical protein JI62_13915 [Halomonas campaniensis]|uniref:Uncharacterized protein n=1 Tax=Halomonas campaniensis TaxID=213554 RepID=A0A246RXE1_9GAMM|nr:hypothetical protein JI62_13915 [Halomonas campaniensis]
MREFFKDQRPFSQRWMESVLTVTAAHLLKTYAILLDRSDPPLRLLKDALPGSPVPCESWSPIKRSEKL